MALCGMPSNLADFSSWAKVMPPSALVAANPKVPSEAVPERITPIALLPWSSASERKNLLRTVVLCAVALILGAVAVRALPEIPDLSGYQSYKPYDPIVMADLRYIAWRGIGVKDCAALSLYRDLRDQNPDRQIMAKAIAAFGEPECGQSNMLALKQAAEYARSVGRKPEADIFDQLAQKTFKPQFGKTDIAPELKVPAKAKAMLLGET